MKPHCPYCELEMSANYSIEGEKYDHPSKNDISVCAYCGGISVFGKNAKTLRKIDDIDKLILDKETLELCLKASKYIKSKNLS